MNILRMVNIEILSLYYALPKIAQIPENDCQPVLLNDERMELNYGKSRFPDKNELMTRYNKN